MEGVISTYEDVLMHSTSSDSNWQSFVILL